MNSNNGTIHQENGNSQFRDTIVYDGRKHYYVLNLPVPLLVYMYYKHVNLDQNSIFITQFSWNVMLDILISILDMFWQHFEQKKVLSTTET